MSKEPFHHLFQGLVPLVEGSHCLLEVVHLCQESASLLLDLFDGCLGLGRKREVGGKVGKSKRGRERWMEGMRDEGGREEGRKINTRE